jgi:hypothetical protein
LDSLDKKSKQEIKYFAEQKAELDKLENRGYTEGFCSVESRTMSGKKSKNTVKFVGGEGQNRLILCACIMKYL